MRDLDQIREKIEIRLEPQQIVVAAVATLIFSAGLFAGGYYMGTQNAPRQEVASTIANIDKASETRVNQVAPAVVEPTPALGEVEFLFPSELNSRPARKRESVKAVRLEATVVAEEKSEKTPAKAKPPKIEVKPVAPKPEAAVRKKRDAGKVTLAVKKAKPRDAGLDATAKALAEAKAAARIASKSAVRDAGKKIDEDAPTAPPTARPTPRRASQYTLQVKAARDKAESDAFVKELRRAGFEPHVILASIPGKGRFYRVRLGRFESMEAARKFQRRYKAKSGQPDGGFVTEL